MDTVNTIKVTVKPTKNDSMEISKKPAVKVDTDKLESKIKDQDSFSNKLKDEIDNNLTSQESQLSTTDSTKEKETNTGGNSLPNESGNKIADDVKDELENELSQILGSEVSDEQINLIVSDLLQGTKESQDLLNSIQKVINSLNLTEQSSNPVSAIGEAKFSQAESIKNIFSTLSVNGGLSSSKSEIIKNMFLLFNVKGELTSSAINKNMNRSLNVTGEFNSVKTFGIDQLSSTQYSSFFQNSGFQNNNLNQQFAEFQMRFLEQDKQLENSFDLSKLTKVLNETQRNLASNESNSLNQFRNVSEFSIKTPVLDKQWNTEFSNNIAYMAKSGGGNAHIKLNPANLGPVEASIKISKEVATIQIVATNISTRDALDNAIPKLKEMLAEQGFSEVNVDISDKNFSHRSSQQSEKSNQETSSVENDIADENEGGLLDSEAIRMSNQSEIKGVVDYFA